MKYIISVVLLFVVSVINAQDKSVIFMNNGQPVSSVTCGNFDKLEVKFPLPLKPGEQYDKIKFTLNVDGNEYRTKAYLKSEIYYNLSGKSYASYTILNRDSSDFTDNTNTVLTKDKFCDLSGHPTYSLKAEAKGFVIVKKEKSKPSFGEPEDFAKGEIPVTIPVQANK